MPKKEQLSEREFEALRYLRNAIVHSGYSPSVRELAEVLGYKSPRTALLVLYSLIERGMIMRRPDGTLQLKRDLPAASDRARTVEVPLVGNVACGAPLLAEENVEAYIPVSTSLAKPGGRYFLLRAIGDSMNRAGIEDGDLVLVRQQSTAESGNRVVALIDDEATIKEFHRDKDVVVLRARSTTKTHQPIVLSTDFIIQGVVIAAIPKSK
jgi:repressor LexA